MKVGRDSQDNMIRKLTWQKEGYAIHNWVGYKPTLDYRLIQHDLYHHQMGELGTDDEEIRALGGDFYFHNWEHWTFVKFLRNANIRFKLTEHKQQFNRLRNTDQLKPITITKKVDEAVDESGVDNPYYFKYRLMEGWDYSKQFPRQAHDNIARIDFLELHFDKLDLLIKLHTGKICDSYLSATPTTNYTNSQSLMVTS